jgi:phage terminase small subunit
MKSRHLRFIQEYLIDENATRAAKDAGFSEKTAYSQGQRLLKNVEVAREIEKGLEEKRKKIEERAKRCEITKERWVKEVALIAFANMDDFVRVGANSIRVLTTEERGKKLGKAIKKISEHTSQHGGSISLELHPKLPALELLAKHFGWIQDKIQHSGAAQVTIQSGKALKKIFQDEKSYALAVELAERLAEQQEGDKNG